MQKNDNNSNYCILVDIENERKRISTELHDDVVQNLVHLSQQIELTLLYLKTDTIAASLELADMKKNLKDTIELIREKIYNLRPMTFDDLGWKCSFSRLYDDLLNKRTWNINFDIDDLAGKYDEILLLSSYRLIKEACTNSYKHSNATKLNVSVKVINEKIIIKIDDNGIGFNLKECDLHNHFGLKEMYEIISLLNGEYSLNTGINEGTHISFVIPTTSTL